MKGKRQNSNEKKCTRRIFSFLVLKERSFSIDIAITHSHKKSLNARVVSLLNNKTDTQQRSCENFVTKNFNQTICVKTSSPQLNKQFSTIFIHLG